MSTGSKPGKKVITTRPSSTIANKTSSSRNKESESQTLMYGKEHYLWMGGGVLMIALGLVLMLGGSMPSPDVWDESIIYSFRRTVVAPIFILAGLGVEIYAIFKR
jgi:hypothetical protein